MAFYLEKERTNATPYVLIDEAKGYMRFEGRCFYENVMEFFRGVNDWLSGYLERDFDALTFDCALEYFNSSTAKLLRNMIVKMDGSAGGGRKITVNWITSGENDIILECGEDIKEDVRSLEFNMVIS